MSISMGVELMPLPEQMSCPVCKKNPRDTQVIREDNPDGSSSHYQVAYCWECKTYFSAKNGEWRPMVPKGASQEQRDKAMKLQWENRLIEVVKNAEPCEDHSKQKRRHRDDCNACALNVGHAVQEFLTGWMSRTGDIL